MKKVFFSIFIAWTLLWLASSCVETQLVFPDVEEAEDLGPIDLISKPSDVKITGDYNYIFKIKWPKFSEKVAKVVVKYIDNGEEITKEYTSFEEDAVINTSQFGEYNFILNSYSNTNLKSSTVSIVAQNKGFIIEEIISNPLISVVDGEVEVKFFNTNGIPYKISFFDAVTNKLLINPINTSAEEFSTRFVAQDGTHDYLIQLEDEEGRMTSKTFTYSFQYIVNTALNAAYGTARLNISNNSPAHISKLKITFPITGGGANTLEQSFNANNGVLSFPAIMGIQTVQIDYEDAVGRKVTRNLTYTQAAYGFKNFNTKVLKSGWTVTASSVQSNDGAGLVGILDGDPNTFWHSQYSTPVPPWPHYVTITFDKEIQITSVTTKNRHNNGNGAPKDFDLQISSDGANFTTHQSFTNTVSTAAGINTHNVNPVATKFVRLLFKNNFTGISSMALGEVDFTGNQNL